MGLDREFPATPAGLGLAVVWGLPYFERYVPGPARRHLPIDRRASGTKGRTVSVLLEAIRFPSESLRKPPAFHVEPGQARRPRA